MAEEKLGTLQYDMLVDQTKLEDSLKKIDALLIATDKKWKDSLSNMGSGSVKGIIETQNALIELARSGDSTVAAGKKVIASNVDIETSYEKLKVEIKEAIAAQEKLTVAQKSAPENQAALASLQKKIDLYAQFKESLNEATKSRKQEDSDAKRKAINDEREIERTKRLTEAQRAKRSALVSEYTNTPQGTVAQLSAGTKVLKFDRSVAEERTEIDRLNRLINQNESARKKLITTQKEQKKAAEDLFRIQKLQAAVDAQQKGSIDQLRASYALLRTQLAQVKLSDPDAINRINQLQSSIRGVKSEIQALQPTLGIWGKLKSAILTYATAYVSVQGIMGLGRAAYNQTKELDSLNFSMKTVIKSSTELAQTQKFLADVAVNYGGDLLTLSERYIKFRAAAVQSNVSAGETQKIFESVSKAAGTLGLKTDELSGVYLALEQMLSKGKVTTEELRRQLGERLPGAFGIMANALGVTIPELDKLLKKGEILSTVALPKFAAALEKAYGIESLKKIDTLAAAQGRLSTEFTGLIKSLGASDAFKGTINSLASLIGFLKDYMGILATTAKVLLAVVFAQTAWKVSIIASIPIQRTLLLLTGNQTSALVQLSFAQKRVVAAQALATAGTTMWAKAWNSLKLAFVSNPLGVILTGITLVGTAMYMLVRGTKEAKDEVKGFADNLSAEKSKLDQLFTSVTRAGKGTYEYKDALFQINNLYGKYLPNLLTEKSSIDEVAKARNLANKSLEEEMMLRERNSRLEVASADKDRVMSEIMNDILAAAPSMNAAKKGQVFARIMDIANIGELDPDKRKALITKAFKGDLSAIEDYVSKATIALEGYKARVTSIDEFFSARADKKIEIFKPETIEAAKKDFEEYAKLQSQGAGQLMISPFIDKDNQTLKQWLENQIKLYKGNEDALRSLYLAQADLDKNQSGQEAKSLKNKENLLEARQKLAQLEIELQQNVNEAILAAMKDGSAKQYAQLDSQYKERLIQIRKQEQEYLKTLNESLGIKITDAGYISKLPADQQILFNKEKLAAKEKYTNDIFKLDEELAKKQQATYDAVAERFMSDVDKQKLSIEKFYSDQIEALKEIYSLPVGRVDEMTGNIIFNPKELDQLKAYQTAVDELIAKKNAELLRVNQETAMKLSPLYQKAFGEIENYGTYALGNLRKQIEEMISSAEQVSIQGRTMMKVNMPNFDEQGRKISDFTTMTIDEFIQWQNKLRQITKQIEEKNPFSALGKSFKSMITAMKSGDKDALSNAVAGFNKNATGAIDLVKQWKQSLEPLMDEDTSNKINKIITGIQGGFDVASGVAKFASGDIIGGVTDTLKGIGELATAFQKNHELSAQQIAEYESLVKVIGEVINKQMELLASLSGTDAVNASKEILNNIEKSVEAARSMGAAYLQSRASHEHSYGYQLREDLRPYVAQINALGVAWDGEATSFMNLSSAQLQVIKTQLPEAWAKLDDKTQQYLQTVMDGTTAIEDLKIALDEALTSLNFDQAKSSLDDLLMNADTTMADVANNFEGYMKKAIVNLITSSLLSVELKKWYEEFAKSMEDGVLSKTEVDGLRLSYQEIYNRGKNLTNAALDAAGIPKTVESSSGISKGIQALTEDTGRRLEGLINSIRESSVINIGNTKQLVESSQMIQGYAAQSLGELRMVNTNLATQIGIFNDWTTTTNGTGGKGIKVYVQ